MLNPRRLVSICALLLSLLGCRSALAQDKGEPGRFDFYLLNLAWAPEFCSVPGASPECKTPTGVPHGFVLHGLWPQNNDGSYPVFCSNESGPTDIARNLDVTPDLLLLQHEWDKHGTCAAVGPERFFRMEHEAFAALRIPARFARVASPKSEVPLSLAPDMILGEFYAANPAYPPGSILLSCGRNRLTAVEACLNKDLKPMRCNGLHTCGARSVKIQTPGMN